MPLPLDPLGNQQSANFSGTGHIHEGDTRSRLDRQIDSLQYLDLLTTGIREVDIVEPDGTVARSSEWLADTERDLRGPVEQPEYPSACAHTCDRQQNTDRRG